MLEEVFQDVYTKFKLHFYQNVFQRFATREATLTTVESFCMEGIMAMGEPTIAEFSRMMRISTPNAAYKIGSLVKKGYVEKIQSTTDRREYYLRPTQKYIDYYSISYSYLHTVIERVRQRFPAEDCDKMEQMLSVISTELMPELDMLAKCHHPEASAATKIPRRQVSTAKQKALPGKTGRALLFAGSLPSYSTINRVPAAMRAQPTILLAVKGSWRNTKASTRVITTLSLSMGTT